MMGIVGEGGWHGIWHLGCNFALVSGAILKMVKGEAQPSFPGPSPGLDCESLLQSLPEAVLLFDLQRRIIDMNKAAEQLFGQTRGELLGTEDDSFFRRVASQDAGTAEDGIVSRVLRGDFVRHQRRIFGRSDGAEPLEVMLSGSPLKNSSGTVIGVLILAQDVTETTGLQRQLASSERHFAVGQMTGGLAHDFNNVLNTISQAVRVLEIEPEPSERDRKMFAVIDNAVRRGSEVVANIREYLRGRREPRSRINLGRLLHEVLELTQPLMAGHDRITVEQRMEKGCEVYANAPELRRVFTNLVLNALDAMPKGGTLSLDCSRSEGYIVASVKDTGTGIAPEAQKMIFSPYFTTKPNGTGLGLVGAWRTIRGQGGDICFESAPGEGTTFYVRLPIANGELNSSVAA